MRRLSIRNLMGFVVVSAVGLAALKNAGELWAGMMLLAALATVGVAIMGAVILRDKERYWWAGFAFFGGGYLALACGPWLSDTFQPQLGTTHLLGQLQGQMHLTTNLTKEDFASKQAEREHLVAAITTIQQKLRNSNDPVLIAAKASLAAIDQKIAAFSRVATRDQFERVGHSIFALLAGLVGGMVATWFYVRRERGDMRETV